MRELQQVRLPLPGEEEVVNGSVLERRAFQRRAKTGHASAFWCDGFECHVVLDVDRPVAGFISEDKEVGLSDPPTDVIRWQPATQDQRRTAGYRHRRGGLKRLGAVSRCDVGIHMEVQQIRDYLHFELAAAFEAALQ